MSVMVAERSTGDADTDVKAAAATAHVDDADTAGATADAAAESNGLKAEEQEGGTHESDADEDNQFEDSLEQEEGTETEGADNNNSNSESIEEEDELKAAAPAMEQSESDAANSVTAHQSVEEDEVASTPSDQVVISCKASGDSTVSTAPISGKEEQSAAPSPKKTSPATTEATKEEPAPRQLPSAPRHEQQSQQQRPATARSATSTNKPFVPLPPSKNWRTMALRSNGQLSRIMQAALLKTLLHAIRRGSAEGVKVAIERGVSLQYIDSRSRNLIMYVG